MNGERYNDGLLNIKTEGSQKGFTRSIHYHVYEPTPYNALDILFAHYELKSSDRLIDFGCGKGRLAFYANYVFNVSAVGVEMNDLFYHESMQNLNGYMGRMKKRAEKVYFFHGLAEEYPIEPQDNRFYFFNPFTLSIFTKVINNILLSYEITTREMELLLYYPSQDYLYYLENQTSFEMVKEIRLPEQYEKNPNERFVIYHLGQRILQRQDRHLIGYNKFTIVERSTVC